MMKALFSVLILVVAFHGFAGTQEPWKMFMNCGHYKFDTYNGVTYDASKYGITLGEARDASGVNRRVDLYEIGRDASWRVGASKDCLMNGKVLTCSVEDISFSLDVSQKPESRVLYNTKFYVYKIKITVPFMMVGSKTYDGTCDTLN